MSDVAKKVIWSVVLSVPSAALSVVLRGVFKAWGVFDPFAEWLGSWLKMHVIPAQVEWTIAGVMALAAYSVLIWIVWRYHRTPQMVDTRRDAGINIEVETATATEMPKLVISLSSLLHPKDATKGLRTVRINIKNISSRTVKNCCVREEEFVNKYGYTSKMRRYFRLSYETYADMAAHTYKKTFDLHPGSAEDIDIAHLDETKDDSPVIMLYATEPTAPTCNCSPRADFA
jgi:hypothetical protein